MGRDSRVIIKCSHGKPKNAINFQNSASKNTYYHSQTLSLSRNMTKAQRESINLRLPGNNFNLLAFLMPGSSVCEMAHTASPPPTVCMNEKTIIGRNVAGYQ